MPCRLHPHRRLGRFEAHPTRSVRRRGDANAFNPTKTYVYNGGRKNHRNPRPDGGKTFWQEGSEDHSLYAVEHIGSATTVYVCEGEKGADVVRQIGATAVATGGSERTCDLNPLVGREVVLIADRDKSGAKWARRLTNELTTVETTSVRVVHAAVDIAKADVVEHITAGYTLDELEPFRVIPADDAGLPGGGSTDGADEKPPKRSQASQLVDMARDVYELGISDTDDPFGVHRDLPHVAMLLRGGRTGLRVGLARDYFAKHDAVASQQALADACAVLEGYATQADPRPLHLRVAEHGGRVYVDMADANGHVIDIGGGHWTITDHAPALFRRTKLTAAMPEPRGPSDLSLLWDFVLVDEQDRPLVLAWLVSTLVQPDAPHPILTLLAEQGATKSSTTKKLVDLVDPSSVPLRQASRDAGAWVTAASASWVVALDNMSGTPPMWLSDSLCRAATGDGDVKRALFTDNDVTVLQMKRCVILNGIDVTIEQGDLAERVATVDLKRVLPKDRRTEADLADAWSAARPMVFSGLLDLAAAVHHRLNTVTVAELPRMADFAKCLAAVDDVLATRGLARYRDRMKRAASDTLSDPFIAAVTDQRVSVIDMPSADLLRQLTPDVAEWKRPKEWPKNARAVTGVLTRNAPALRQQGWFIDNDGGQNKRNVVLWTLTPPEKDGEEPSPPSPDSSSQVDPQKSGESDEVGFLADTSPYLAADHGEEPASQRISDDSPKTCP